MTDLRTSLPPICKPTVIFLQSNAQIYNNKKIRKPMRTFLFILMQVSGLCSCIIRCILNLFPDILPA